MDATKVRKLAKRALRAARRIDMLLLSVEQNAETLHDLRGAEDGPYDHYGIAMGAAQEAQRIGEELKADLAKLRRLTRQTSKPKRASKPRRA